MHVPPVSCMSDRKCQGELSFPFPCQPTLPRHHHPHSPSHRTRRPHSTSTSHPGITYKSTFHRPSDAPSAQLLNQDHPLNSRSTPLRALTPSSSGPSLRIVSQLFRLGKLISDLIGSCGTRRPMVRSVIDAKEELTPLVTSALP